MLERLADVDWTLETQPSWNGPDDVCRALRGVAQANAESSHAAYSRLLYAVGNNHAGTYFPVVLKVIPFLGEIVRDGGEVARRIALDVLIDLVGAFEPESGCEHVATEGGPRSLRELVAERIAALKPDVERRCAAGADATLAAELLDLLPE